MANRLADQKSPYLLQHAENPVEWYPWGKEALERAREEDRPILVSIGYSACHWCHVMERESFEDEDTAKLMNEHFVNIKVDREERPDVDAIYMEAVQALSGQGGWPLNVFLTPEGKPFYGGTYFPPQPGRGMPTWTQVLQSVADAYENRRGDVEHNAATLTEYVRRAQRLAQSADEMTPDILRLAYQQAAAQFDLQNGGFGGAPKFPQPLSLDFLLRMHRRLGKVDALAHARFTADKMAAGGIYDHLGGGFHRYAVDSSWVVPHFEKMLYDNALLARVYLHLFQITGSARYRAVVEETLDYVLREMRSAEGAFYSAEDADSEGEEGKYYVWSPDELEHLLGEEDAHVLGMYYGVEKNGNFEGNTILTLSKTADEIAHQLSLTPETVEEVIARSRRALLAARSRRVPPGKDTKVLVSWNALAIRALAEAAATLDRSDYLAAAEHAAEFLLEALRPAGRLMRSYRDGPGQIPAFLEDYSYLVEALLTLYETAFNRHYLITAQELAEEMVRRFWDDGHSGFFDVDSESDELVARPRGFFDNPIPSGNAAASFALLRLNALTGKAVYEKWAQPAFRVARDLMIKAPLGFSYLLSALDFFFSSQTQVAIIGDVLEEAARRLARVVSVRFMPNAVLAFGPSDDTPLLEGRTRIEGRPAVYVCEHFVCRMPVTDEESLSRRLDEDYGLP